MHAEAPARHARPTPAALLLLSAGMAAAMLSGCHSHSASVTPEPQPVVETEAPAPVTAELSPFGDDEFAWASPDSLPADPIPMTASPDSADVSRVTTAEQGADFDPTISADGRYMVFASTQHSLNADIYIKRTGSKVITQLTNDPGRDVMPSISPDGAWIAFASDRVSNWNIYVMPVTGGRPVQITSNPSSGLKFRLLAVPFQHTPSITALSSFKVRYIWPDAATFRPEISPRRRTWPNASSTTRLIAPAISLTEYSSWLC